MIQQTNKREHVFLEVTRIRPATNPKFGQAGAMRYAAWCNRCVAKVNLIAQNEFTNINTLTGALHVRIVLGGELLVCLNSLTRKESTST